MGFLINVQQIAAVKNRCDIKHEEELAFIAQSIYRDRELLQNICTR